ncbi:N-acetylmuramoyl-L-alanine amidase [Methylomonas montana]|uniref:N-acetylmuramoyl-L-alanine amidase n=1 Tax=Methylomonas montana TaxID=3058963 RepID=UPI00265A484F|nr:N-acetylmuramoyl-L-alanine amidase [Methylomonas montana]WKJ91811.1 N-acetylmuramoyl-L-alanine amidase [Methylomonas montana]
MQQIYRIFWIWGMLLPSFSVFAAQAELGSVSYSASNQVVFNLPGAVRHKAFVLKSPSRLVVDFIDAKISQSIAQPPADHPLFGFARSAARNTGDLRVVVELKSDADAKVAVIGKSLQIDLAAKAAQQEPLAAKSEKIVAAVAALEKTNAAVKKQEAAVKPVAVKTVTKAKGRNIVVAIDAGHGGKDVGAQGANGTQEKDVVFAIAKNLEGLVNSQPGMKAVMIRDGDYFVKLNERRRIARTAKADLFVSIHADAFSDSQAHGASVYTLANKGASSAGAGWLADSENAVDGAAGAGEDRDETLASVLMDLSSKAAKEASQNIGNKVLRSVKSVGHLHRSAVQKAGFVVLKSPEIPSILVETAFISNPEEERRLKTHAYQHKMASAVFSGIVGHFKQYAPADTMMAQLNRSTKSKAVQLAALDKDDSMPAAKPKTEQKPVLAAREVDANPTQVASNTANQHVINRGETLSGIAQQYGISMRALRLANAMNDGNVRIGQVLQIPRDS